MIVRFSNLINNSEVKQIFILVFKKILRLEEELEALGGGDTGEETTRSNVIKTPNLSPRKVGSIQKH